MENKQEEIRPTLKLSRCSRKRVIAPKPQPKVNKQPKRRRKKRKDDIPIPSFSPVRANLQVVDTSVLDSPPPKPKEEEKVDTTSSILYQDDDDDDDDDDALLMGPPTFAPSQTTTSAQTKTAAKTNKSEEKKPPAATKKDAKSTAKLDANITLSKQVIETIEALVHQVDLSTTTPKDLTNRVVAKHGYKGNKTMRKLIRERIKSRSKQVLQDRNNKDSSQTTEPASDKENTTKTTTSFESSTVEPDEDDLAASIDYLFAQDGAKEATLAGFYVNLEAQYGAKLCTSSREFVKNHLQELHCGSSLESCSQDTATLLAETAALQPAEEEANKQEEDNDGMLLDNDDDAGPSFMDDAEEQTAVKETQKKTEPSGEKETALKPKPKRRGRPRKQAKPDESLVDITDESNTKQAAKAVRQEQPVEKPVPKRKQAAPRKPRAPRAKKGTCALCTTCTCTIGKEMAKDTPATMSRNDADIERALIRRAKKLEGIIGKYEGLLDNVNRELKKHRRAIWKKEEEQINNGRRLAFGDTRFLPDADVWDEQAEAVQVEALSPTVVQEAKETVFGSGNCQVTLTQMFGGGGGRKETDENVDSNGVDEEKNVAVLEVPSKNDVADEEKEAVSDAEDSAEEEAQEMEDGEEAEEPPVDNIHRLAWRKGTQVETQSPLLRGNGAWSALTTNTIKSSLVGIKPSLSNEPVAAKSLRAPSDSLLLPPSRTSNYNCAWDALFSDDMDDDDDTNMDQLLDLFETEMADNDNTPMSDATQDSSTLSQQSTFESVLLTQRGESIVEAIEQEVTSDPDRLHSIEAVCPKWRDNVRYACSHRGHAEIDVALKRVRHSMTNLQNTKEKVSTVWKRQEIVLELFEASLSASLVRLSEDSANGSLSEDANDDDHPSIQEKESTALSPILEVDEEVTQS